MSLGQGFGRIQTIREQRGAEFLVGNPNGKLSLGQESSELLQCLGRQGAGQACSWCGLRTAPATSCGRGRLRGGRPGEGCTNHFI